MLTHSKVAYCNIVVCFWAGNCLGLVTNNIRLILQVLFFKKHWDVEKPSEPCIVQKKLIKKTQKWSEN